MKWLQRGFSFFIIGVVAYIVYELAVQHNSIDPALIAALSFCFNVVIYFIGRSDKHEETKYESHANRGVLCGSDLADTQPSNHGAVHGHSDEEHTDLSQGSG